MHLARPRPVLIAPEDAHEPWCGWESAAGFFATRTLADHETLQLTDGASTVTMPWAIACSWQGWLERLVDDKVVPWWKSEAEQTRWRAVRERGVLWVRERAPNAETTKIECPWRWAHALSETSCRLVACNERASEIALSRLVPPLRRTDLVTTLHEPRRLR